MKKSNIEKFKRQLAKDPTWTGLTECEMVKEETVFTFTNTESCDHSGHIFVTLKTGERVMMAFTDLLIGGGYEQIDLETIGTWDQEDVQMYADQVQGYIDAFKDAYL